MSNKQVSIKVHAQVLVNLKINGISASDACLTIWSLANEMLQFPPTHKAKSKNGHWVYNTDTWILRGYYPGTKVFFRITVGKVSNDLYCANVIIPRSNAKRQIIHIRADKAEALFNESLQSHILDAKPISKTIDNPSLPKVTSPKGMRRLELP